MSNCLGQTVQRLATGGTVRGSNPGGGRDFHTHVARLWDPHKLLYKGKSISDPGIKRTRRGVDHWTPSRTEVKERTELYLYCSSGTLWPIIVWTLHFKNYLLLQWSPSTVHWKHVSSAGVIPHFFLICLLCVQCRSMRPSLPVRHLVSDNKYRK